MMVPARRRLTVVSDSLFCCNLIDDMLIAQGYETLTCFTGSQAYQRMQGAQNDLIAVVLWTPQIASLHDTLTLLALAPTTTPAPVLLCVSELTAAREDLLAQASPHSLVTVPCPSSYLQAVIESQLSLEQQTVNGQRSTVYSQW